MFRCNKKITLGTAIFLIIFYLTARTLPRDTLPSMILPSSHEAPAQVNTPKDSVACYRVKSESLPDISDAIPRKGKSIFFHETSCKSYVAGKIVINSRQACAVESAAKLNSNYDVYLLFTSPGIFKFEGTESDRFLQVIF